MSRDFPFLVFENPERVGRQKLGGGPGRQFQRPTASRQGERLNTKWEALREAFATRQTQISSQIAGVDPELVVVLEIIGEISEFSRAVSRIAGFEFLAEIDEIDLSGDGDFIDLKDPDSQFDGTLFLVATNQSALAQLLNLWNQYQELPDVRFPQNLGRIKQVFGLLRDVRRWSSADRLRGTGALEDFRERANAGQETVRAEIELWFRGDSARRTRAQEAVTSLVQDANGTVLSSVVIQPIAYHALLVSLPISSVQSLISDNPDSIALVRAEEIAFVRPQAQAAIAMLPAEEEIHAELPSTSDTVSGQPLVAILDGVPLARHVLLDGRLSIDDPDDWENSVPAADRLHGTAIASLVVHGDYGARNGTPTRPIYMRPILYPDRGWPGLRESIPPNQLAIDAIHSAVIRMLGDDDVPGVSPNVKLINLSIGDSASPLGTVLSPWSRLLDWLAYKYRVVFVISAGNHSHLVYPHSTITLTGSTDPEFRSMTLSALAADSHNRRILSPSEAVNCLCVGASHDDACSGWTRGSRIDLLPSAGRGAEASPSPTSAIGLGYLRSVKPDFLAPGGRLLYRSNSSSSSSTTYVPSTATGIAPGLEVATPGGAAGTLDAVRYFAGTSGAAAMASHFGSLILEQLAEMGRDTGDEVSEAYWGVLTKALLVHATALPSTAAEVRTIFQDLPPDKLKDALARCYGYGVINPEKVLTGKSTRATVLGWGSLEDGEAARFVLPLPPSLSRTVDLRRLILTVAYFAPIRTGNRLHRAASLYVIPEKDVLRLSRVDADWRTVRRGTVQHEILNGDAATTFVDGDSISFQVNCRKLVTGSVGAVPFGLAVTLEVGENVEIPIHAEIAERLRARVRTRLQSR